MRAWNLHLLALLVACGGDKDTTPTDADTTPADGDADADADADTDTDADADADCTAQILTVDPEPGSNTVALDTDITAVFTAAIQPTDPYGITVAGVTGTTTLDATGMSMTFVPDAPLSPETSYTVEVSVCDDVLSTDYVTLPPPVDVADVEGNTYVLSWPSVNITEPTAGALLKAFIPIDFVLLQIESIDPVTLQAPSIATIGTDDGLGNAIPDCDAAIAETADFSLNPLFVFQGDIQLAIDPAKGLYADVEDFELMAEVSADGQQITDIRLSGLVATEQFLGDTETCAAGTLVGAFNPTCLPCSISTVAPNTCMLLEGDAAMAIVQPALDLAGTCGL